MESLRRSPSFPPGRKGGCYEQRAGDKLMESHLPPWNQRRWLWPSVLQMGSVTTKEIMAEGCEPLLTRSVI